MDEEFKQFKALNVNYQSATGILNHIACYTQPDISFAVSSLSRFNAKPGLPHWNKLKKTWNYLKGTPHIKLWLKVNNLDSLTEAYSDASWADDPTTRQSQTGYPCMVHGCVVSWNSSKQRNITFSSTDAELNALVDAFHKATWIRALMCEIFSSKLTAITIHTNNRGLMDKLENFGFNSRMQHLDLKTKGMREEVKSGNLRIQLIKLEAMPADALTKSASLTSLQLLHSSFASLDKP